MNLQAVYDAFRFEPAVTRAEALRMLLKDEPSAAPVLPEPERYVTRATCRSIEEWKQRHSA